MGQVIEAFAPVFGSTAGYVAGAIVGLGIGFVGFCMVLELGRKLGLLGFWLRDMLRRD